MNQYVIEFLAAFSWLKFNFLEGGREERRKGGKEEGRKGGREEGREGRREIQFKVNGGMITRSEKSIAIARSNYR